MLVYSNVTGIFHVVIKSNFLSLNLKRMHAYLGCIYTNTTPDIHGIFRLIIFIKIYSISRVYNLDVIFNIMK